MSAPASEPVVDPFEHLLDVLLYAPIGFIARSADALPELAAVGRDRARNARALGQFALGTTNAKARQAVSDAESHLSAFFRIVTDSASPATKSQTVAPDTKGASPKVASVAPKKRSPKKSSKPTLTIDDAIAGYDELTASQLLPLLAGLSAEQRLVVEAYEQSQRSRKTILNRIRQLKV